MGPFGTKAEVRGRAGLAQGDGDYLDPVAEQPRESRSLAEQVRDKFLPTKAEVRSSGGSGLVEGNNANTLSLDPDDTREVTSVTDKPGKEKGSLYERAKEKFAPAGPAMSPAAKAALMAFGATNPSIGVPIAAHMYGDATIKGAAGLQNRDMATETPSTDRGEGDLRGTSSQSLMPGFRQAAQAAFGSAGGSGYLQPAEGAPGSPSGSASAGGRAVGGGQSSGGAGALGDLARARLAAGDVGTSPEMASAEQGMRKQYVNAQDAADARIRTMEDSLVDRANAARKVAEAQEARAAEIRQHLDTRMGEEAELRAQLRQRADIDPQGYFNKHPSGPVAARIFTGLGAVLSGLAGPEYLKNYTDRVDAAISRDIESQAKSYQNRMGLAKEVRQQWDDRFSVLGDIHSAKTSARVQELEAARDYFMGQAQLTKNDDARARLMEAAGNFDLKAATHRQGLKEETGRQLSSIYDKRDARARAAAAQQAAYARQDKLLADDRDFKRSMQKEVLQSREHVAQMRSQRMGGAAGEAGVNPGKFADLLGKYGKDRKAIDEYKLTLKRATDLLDKEGDDVRGYGPIAKQLPPWAISDEGKALRQAYEDVVSSEVYKRSGKAITKEEMKRMDAILKGAGSKKELMWATGKLKEMESVAEESLHRGTLPSVRKFYDENGE